VGVLQINICKAASPADAAGGGGGHGQALALATSASGGTSIMDEAASGQQVGTPYLPALR
jgi:hypothetical protein